MSKKEPKLIYLDVCALCRPFDDQSYLRIRMETEAVNLILSKVKENFYQMVVSPVHIKEIEAIQDEIERIQLLILLNKYGKSIKVDFKKTRKRAEELVELGFGVADAAHVAFAEMVGADFISCDKRLVKKCIRHKIKVWCGNPLSFCEKEDLR
jgi:predicted nucleic acid-binding protein